MNSRRAKASGKRSGSKPQPAPRRPGRPALGETKRSKRIQILVTPEVDARVTAAAEAAGCRSVSDWGETVLLRALGDDTTT